MRRLVLALAFAAAIGTADAFEMGGGNNDGLLWNDARGDFLPNDPVLVSNHDNIPGLTLYQNVVSLPNRWPQTQTLHVCFVGGRDPLRKRILDIAQTWFNLTNLTLDRGGPNGRSCAASGEPAEIRIGFSEPGYWSYIGTESIHPQLTANNLTSMNFGGMDRAPPPDPRFTGTILHEFGHALGFHHEHQSPAGGCETEYKWPELYAWAHREYGWNETKTRDNFLPLIADHSAYDWSEIDPMSIMIYETHPDFLVHREQSPCYFHENQQLSALDREGARQAYPRENALLALRLQAVTLPLALETTTLSPEVREALTRQSQLTQFQLGRVTQ